MPYLYFGFEPRNRGASKLAVKTESGQLEPAEPSKIKVFSQAPFIPMWSLFARLLGLAVAILSFPQYSYISTSTVGLKTNAAPTNIPLKTPGIAVVLKKGVSLSVENVTTLEEMGFSSMQFSGRTIWLKDFGSREIFLKVDVMAGVDPLGPCPARYLNTHSFRAFLVLRSFTSRVCELFHYLTESHSDPRVASQGTNSAASNDEWVDVLAPPKPDDTNMEPPGTFAFKKSMAHVLEDGCDKTIASLYTLTGSVLGIANNNSGVVRNPLSKPMAGYLIPGDISSIKAPGRIFKFHPQLALPDPNIIGDIIGRHFLAGLGDSYEDQLENLDLLKTGIAGLRLTRVGEELSHLYKCLEIAIEASTGCVPIFSRRNYEGCVLMGGSSKRNFLINGSSYPLLTEIELKNDMLSVSDHDASLQYISSLFPLDDRTAVRNTSSMFGLRELCSTLVATQDIRDEIIRKASLLDYGIEQWVINPSNLKECMNLIASPSDLASGHPIGRMSLFSKDPVLVALSCFGEKTSPSWDIPNGIQVSLSKPNPPSLPLPKARERGSSSKGEISDAAWVMVIRQTDLFSAVEEFKRMASTLKYRSSSSSLAKRVGHRVFSRDRMAEFWGPMREALRVVNPLAAFETEEGTLKRAATDSSATEKGDNLNTKKRRMDF